MKRIISVALMVSMLSPNFAFAQDDVTVHTTNTPTATGGNAASNQNQGQEQTNTQGQEQEIEATQTFNNLNRREHITAQPGPNGNFINIPPIVETEVFLPYFGVVYTVEELGYIRDSASYGDRPGFWSFMTSPVKRTLHMKRYSGQIDVNASIELVDKSKCNLVKTLGVYHGTGAYGYPMEAILAYTLLQAKEETNASYYEVTYKTRKNPSVSGFAIGSGAASSLISGGSNDRAAGSLSVGAVIGSSTAYIGYAFDVEVRAVVVSKREAVYVPPAIIAPPPPAPVCNPADIWAKIDAWWQKCMLCKYFCHNNLVIRYNLAKLYIDLFVCTGNMDYLVGKNGALEHLRIAKDNYEQGVDTRSGKLHAESLSIYKDVNYLRAGVYFVSGDAKRADEIALKYRLERYPRSFSK